MDSQASCGWHVQQAASSGALHSRLWWALLGVGLAGKAAAAGGRYIFYESVCNISSKAAEKASVSGGSREVPFLASLVRSVLNHLLRRVRHCSARKQVMALFFLLFISLDVRKSYQSVSK